VCIAIVVRGAHGAAWSVWRCFCQNVVTFAPHGEAGHPPPIPPGSCVNLVLHANRKGGHALPVLAIAPLAPRSVGPRTVCCDLGDRVAAVLEGGAAGSDIKNQKDAPGSNRAHFCYANITCIHAFVLTRECPSRFVDGFLLSHDPRDEGEEVRLLACARAGSWGWGWGLERGESRACIPEAQPRACRCPFHPLTFRAFARVGRTVINKHLYVGQNYREGIDGR
jgi:hypothetical protein